MQQPLRITFHGIERSDAVEARIREKMAELDRRHSGKITSCHATVAASHHNGHHGALYALHLDIHVPDRQINVGQWGKDQAHEDIYVAVRDSFDAATRQLDEHVRRRSGSVKTHEAPLHGKITRLFIQDGYGFVTLSDGLDVYFGEHAVVGARFEGLAVGDELRVVLAEGEGVKGPQASSVVPIGKHHVVSD